MAEYELHRTAGDAEVGDYELCLAGQVVESWEQINHDDAVDKSRDYLICDVLGCSDDERKVWTNVMLQIPFVDDTLGE